MNFTLLIASLNLFALYCNFAKTSVFKSAVRWKALQNSRHQGFKQILQNLRICNWILFWFDNSFHILSDKFCEMKFRSSPRTCGFWDKDPRTKKHHESFCRLFLCCFSLKNLLCLNDVKISHWTWNTVDHRLSLTQKPCGVLVLMSLQAECC